MKTKSEVRVMFRQLAAAGIHVDPFVCDQTLREAVEDQTVEDKKGLKLPVLP